MTLLEELRALQHAMRNLARRVELDAVAEAFVKGDHSIQEGDHFLYYGSTPTRLQNINSEGKWTFWDGHHCVEPHAIPRQEDHRRLYTIEEVAEIVAKARKL